MRPQLIPLLSISISILVAGCATQRTTDPTWHCQEGKKFELKLSPEVEDRILALNPEHVTEKDIKEILSQAPAPRIINIRGGIYPVYLVMASFSEFLEGMGYPEASIRDPGNGSFSYSCYESAGRFAGMVGWFYEHEGLRPMIIGHSQGGIQAVKVLHTLTFSQRLHPWNPLTEKAEHGYDIVDPLTGQKVPVVNVKASYATAVSAGGLTRILPNQWDMTTKLRKIPDSVEEFTGFSKGNDPFGGDWWGYAKANQYHSMGTAVVRNVRLPSGYNHATIPNTKHLLKSQAMIDWINNYTPTNTPQLDVKFYSDSEHILWAADVWSSVKKHWVLELQRLIRAKRGQPNVRR